MANSDSEKKINNLESRIAKLEKFLKPQMEVETNLKELAEKAASIVAKYQEVSTSLLQRTLSIGYSRATMLMDILEEKGLVGPAEGGKPRKVIKK